MSDQGRAILFVLVAVLCGTVNDVGIKLLSGDYPLHQTVFFRSVVALSVSLIFLWREGGLVLLRTDRPGLHALRAGLVMLSNMLFFAGLAVMPLAAATALFFVAPLFITLIAIPVLGEPVGRYRLTAIGIGLAGVAVMMAPGVDWGEIGRVSLLLPLAAAACYSGMQVLTRKLGARSAASAMAVYIQGCFLLVSLSFFVVAGDGRFAQGATHPSVIFLLRAWVWPAPEDLPVFAMIGVMSAMIGYFMSLAYRLGRASVVASYEYAALPLAIFWGWTVFGEVPRPAVWVGIALIAGAGLYVFQRERAQGRTLASVRPVRRD
ncbi:DMT family transporter [Roseicyclus marinus]|uniref:DMT family transporter n=1 Tax=Roseicyclus marinus TaxID=2161673 RepID=UPI00240FAF0B|nr:DMT family transporter [Roseicyclus marinus]MDG3042701.1 DMT family transporter [Roseicyclus marinus]